MCGIGDGPCLSAPSSRTQANISWLQWLIDCAGSKTSMRLGDPWFRTSWINMGCPKLTVLVCVFVLCVCCTARPIQADTLWNPFGSVWSTSAIMNAVSKDAVPWTHMICLPPAKLLSALPGACLPVALLQGSVSALGSAGSARLLARRVRRLACGRILVGVSGPSFVPYRFCSCITLVNKVSSYEWPLPSNSVLFVAGDGLVQKITSRLCSTARLPTSCSHSWRRLARPVFYRRFHGWRFACT